MREFWNYTHTTFKSPNNDADMPLFYEAFHDEFDRDFVFLSYMHSLMFVLLIARKII